LSETIEEAGAQALARVDEAARYDGAVQAIRRALGSRGDSKDPSAFGNLPGTQGDGQAAEAFEAMAKPPARFRRDPKVLIALGKNPAALREYLWLCSLDVALPGTQGTRVDTTYESAPATAATGRPRAQSIAPEKPAYFLTEIAGQKSIEEIAADLRYLTPPDMRPPAAIYAELGHALHAARRYGQARRAFEDAIIEDSQSADLCLYLGRTRESQERYDEALRSYLKAVLLQPVYVEGMLPKAYRLLTLMPDSGTATAAWLEGEWAAEHAMSTLEMPAAVVVWQFLGSAALLRCDYRQAVTHLRRAQERRPDDLWTLTWLGEALWRGGEAAAAAATLERAVDLADEQAVEVERAMLRLRLGRVLLDLVQYEQTIAVIEKGLAFQPDRADAFLVVLARAYLAVGRTQQALATATEVLAASPEEAEAHAVRAAALYAMHDEPAALDAAEAALRLDPAQAEARRVKALVLLDDKSLPLSGKFDEAIRLLWSYTRQKPGDIEAQRALVQALRANNRPIDEITDALRNMVANAPPEYRPAVLVDLAEVTLQQSRDGRAVDVISALNEAAERDPAQRTPRWWRLLGDAYRDRGEFQGALDGYHRGLLEDAHDLSLLERYATLLEETGRSEDALEPWQTVAQTAPERPDAQFHLARLLNARGDHAAALEAVKRAIDAAGDNPLVLEATDLKCALLEDLKRPAKDIAAAYFDAGQRRYWKNELGAAVTRFRRAKELNPEHTPTYWYLADALIIDSFLPAAPYVDRKKLDDGHAVWEAAPATPEDSQDAWAYLTRAQIAELRGRQPDRDAFVEYWKAVTYVERALVLRDWQANFWVALSRYHRYLRNRANALSASDKAVEIEASNAAASEERAAIFVDSGRYEDALETIERRGSVTPSEWLAGVKALALFRLGRFDEALPLISAVLEADSEDLWSRGVRGEIYQMLDNPAAARQDFAFVADRCRDPSIADGLDKDTCADAAYYLGILSEPPDRQRLTEAGGAFAKSLEDPVSARYSYRMLGWCYTAAGEFADAEEAFAKSIERATYAYELDNFTNLDIKLVEKRLPSWPHAAGVRDLIVKLQGMIEERRRQIQEPPAPIDELKQTLAAVGSADPTDGWARTGALAGLARVHVRNGDWAQAVPLYRELAQTGRFPEADAALRSAVNELCKVGDALMREGKSAEALVQFQLALDLLPSIGDSSEDRRGLQARIAVARYDIDDTAGAHAAIVAGLGTTPATGFGDPGALRTAATITVPAKVSIGGLGALPPAAGHSSRTLAASMTEVVRDVSHYWAIDAALEAWVADADDPEIGRDLAELRVGLLSYLDTTFGLGLSSTKSQLAQLTPIVLEMGEGLIPADAASKWAEWTLFQTYIPEMRTRIENETGVPMTGVRVRGNNDLSPGDYVIMLDEVPQATGVVPVKMRYCPEGPTKLYESGIPGAAINEAPNPRTGQPGSWIASEYWEAVTGKGYTLWAEPLVYVVQHVEAELRRNLADFLYTDDVEALLTTWALTEPSASIISRLLTDQAARMRLGRVLRALAADRVPLTPAQNILAAVRGAGLDGSLVDVVRRTRLHLRPQLPGNDGQARQWELSGNWEDRFRARLRHEGDRTYFDAPVDLRLEFLAAIRASLPVPEATVVLVLGDTVLRPFIRRILAAEFPDLLVLARDEALIPPKEAINA
jgi:tetratricopeptide (TPR) repeat protein